MSRELGGSRRWGRGTHPKRKRIEFVAKNAQGKMRSTNGHLFQNFAGTLLSQWPQKSPTTTVCVRSEMEGSIPARKRDSCSFHIFAQLTGWAWGRQCPPSESIRLRVGAWNASVLLLLSLTLYPLLPPLLAQRSPRTHNTGGKET